MDPSSLPFPDEADGACIMRGSACDARQWSAGT